MKQLICLLLAAVFLFSSLSAAANEDNSLTRQITDVLWKQPVTDVFFPVLPEGYKIIKAENPQQGYYSFSLSYTKGDARYTVSKIEYFTEQFNTSALSSAELLNTSFYKYLLRKEGIQNHTVSKETTELLKQTNPALLNGSVESNTMPYKLAFSSGVVDEETRSVYGFVLSPDNGKTLIQYQFQKNPAPYPVDYNGDLLSLLMQEMEKFTFACVGDITMDGAVNAVDALWALQYAVRPQKITEDNMQLHILGDCNRDQTVDAKDALWILKQAVL